MKLNIYRNRTRTTKWNLFFHYCSIFINILIGIVLVPLYLKYIPADTYAYWIATGNILAWLSIIDPGFSAVVQQKVAYYYGAKDLKIVGSYTFWGFLFTAILIILIMIIGFIISLYFTHWLGINNLEQANSLISAFNYAIIGTGLTLFSFIIVSVNQGLQSSLGIGLVYVFVQLSSVVLVIILLKKNYGIESLGIASLWRGFFSVLGNIIYLAFRIVSEGIKIGLDRMVLKEFIKLMSFNVLGKVSGLIRNNLNYFLIAKFLSPEDVNIFRFTQSAPEMATSFLVRPSVAVTPSLTHLLGDGKIEKVREIILRFVYYIIWGLGIFTLSFFLLNKYFVNLWVGKNFYGGEFLNFLIVFYSILTTISNSFYNFLFALGNIKKNNLIIFFQSIFYLILLIIALKFIGLVGVMLALIISEVTFSLHYFTQTLFKQINLSKKKILTIILEIIKVIIGIILICVAFKITIKNLESWIEFGLSALALVLIYFLLLLIISSNFRNETLLLKLKLKKY